MNKFIYGLIFCFAVSCYNDEKFYSLQFKDNVDEVRDSLIEFNKLFNKIHVIKPVYKDDSLLNPLFAARREVTFSKNLSINFTDKGSWDSIKTDTALLYNFPELKALSVAEKHRFWNLFQFMIDHEINGANLADEITHFFFRQYPFSNRLFMYIAFEADFNNLTIDEREFLLQNQLIIDKRVGLLLIIGNKGRFLRYIYGSDANVPSEWKKPTEKIFRAHVK